MHSILMYGQDPREFDENEDEPPKKADDKAETSSEEQNDDEDTTEKMFVCASNEVESDDDEATAEELWGENLVNDFFRRKEEDCTVWRYDRAMCLPRRPRVHLDGEDGERDAHDGLLKEWTKDGERDKEEKLLEKMALRHKQPTNDQTPKVEVFAPTLPA